MNPSPAMAMAVTMTPTPSASTLSPIVSTVARMSIGSPAEHALRQSGSSVKLQRRRPPGTPRSPRSCGPRMLLALAQFGVRQLEDVKRPLELGKGDLRWRLPSRWPTSSSATWGSDWYPLRWS
jgi:hypothetical protein